MEKGNRDVMSEKNTSVRKNSKKIILQRWGTDDANDDDTTLKRCCYWYLWLHNGSDAFDTDLPNMSAALRIYYTKNWFIRKFITL